MVDEIGDATAGVPPSETTPASRLEAQKLELEIADLRKPFFRKPSFWISIASTVIAAALAVDQISLWTSRSRKAETDLLLATLTQGANRV